MSRAFRVQSTGARPAAEGVVAQCAAYWPWRRCCAGMLALPGAASALPAWKLGSIDRRDAILDARRDHNRCRRSPGAHGVRCTRDGRSSPAAVRLLGDVDVARFEKAERSTRSDLRCRRRAAGGARRGHGLRGRRHRDPVEQPDRRRVRRRAERAPPRGSSGVWTTNRDTGPLVRGRDGTFTQTTGVELPRRHEPRRRPHPARQHRRRREHQQRRPGTPTASKVSRRAASTSGNPRTLRLSSDDGGSGAGPAAGDAR